MHIEYCAHLLKGVTYNERGTVTSQEKRELLGYVYTSVSKLSTTFCRDRAHRPKHRQTERLLPCVKTSPDAGWSPVCPGFSDAPLSALFTAEKSAQPYQRPLSCQLRMSQFRVQPYSAPAPYKPNHTKYVMGSERPQKGKHTGYE